MKNLPFIEGENWKEIPGYNYLISDHGRIYSKLTHRILKTPHDADGYPITGLSKNGTTKSFRVSVLEMKIFNGPPHNSKMHVMHLDDNPANNLLTNLKYGTCRENVSDSYNKGRHQKAIDLKKKFGTVFNPVKRVYLLGKEGEKEICFDSARQVEEKLGISRFSVSKACSKQYLRKDGKPNRVGGLVFSY